MMNSAQKPVLIALALAAALVAGLAILSNRHSDELVIHCAAVLFEPLEELRPGYEKASGTHLNITYDGSGALLGRLRVPGTPGDLFLAAERTYLVEAEREGLVCEVHALARLDPVLATQPGNPKNIRGLNDLLREDVRVSLADPDAAAAGNVTRRILKELNLWEKFTDRVKAGGVSYQGTVSKAAGDVALGAADVSVVWVPTARATNLEAIHDPVLDANPEQAMLGI